MKTLVFIDSLKFVYSKKQIQSWFWVGLVFVLLGIMLDLISYRDLGFVDADKKYPRYVRNSFQYSPRLPILNLQVKTYRPFNFKSVQRDHLIEKMLASLPTHLRENAYFFIRPVIFLSEKYQVDPVWILSILWTESHFKIDAISSAGARGPMQIMPETKSYLKKLARKKKIKLESKHFVLDRNSLHNLELGVIYLKHLLERFDNNYHLATVAYNLGPVRVKRMLAKSYPVGSKNRYLNKVRSAYETIWKNLGAST